MTEDFQVGDRVRWNSEVGYVEGIIVATHTSDVDYEGYIHRCSPEHPQYEIRSVKTDHVALHRPDVLTKV